MWEEFVEKCPGLTLAHPPEEGDGFVKLQLRVANKKDWAKKVVKVLESVPDEDPEYSVAINKSYYLGEHRSPTFSWVLILWGDLEAARDSLLEILGAGEVPTARVPPPVMVEAATPGKASRLIRQTRRKANGEVVVETTAPLPHYQGERNTKYNKDSARKFGDGQRGAVVSASAEAGATSE